MLLPTLFNKLNSIEGFTNKVAYRSFPVGNAPEPPFICYLETGSNNAFADNRVYKKINGIEIELYSENKDTLSEERIESVLDENMLPWEKDEDYIESERMLRVTYRLEI